MAATRSHDRGRRRPPRPCRPRRRQRRSPRSRRRPPRGVGRRRHPASVPVRPASTRSCSMPPAPVSVRCAAAPTPVGASPRPTSRSSPICSGAWSDAALDLLRPGGELTYSVCTLTRAESAGCRSSSRRRSPRARGPAGARCAVAPARPCALPAPERRHRRHVPVADAATCVSRRRPLVDPSTGAPVVGLVTVRLRPGPRRVPAPIAADRRARSRRCHPDTADFRP